MQWAMDPCLCDGMGRQTDTNFDDQTIAYNFVRSYFDFCIAIIAQKPNTINEWERVPSAK